MDIPGYRDLQDIYRGHRHVVHRTRRSHDDHPVVIKAVTPGPFAASRAQALRREYAILSDLQLERVARPVGLVGAATTPVLVLEDAGPHCLKDWLRHRPLEVGVFLPLAIQIVEALAGLHQRNIVHHDINPANIVLDATAEHITLVDFDAATTGASAPPTPGGPDAILGTLAYIAPEQTGRMNRGVDHRYS